MIRNARVQLLATALNNLGVGAIIAGFITPKVTGNGSDILLWLAFGFLLICSAHVVLGELR